MMQHLNRLSCCVNIYGLFVTKVPGTPNTPALGVGPQRIEPAGVEGIGAALSHWTACRNAPLPVAYSVT